MSKSFEISPIPSNRFIKDFASNDSKSSKCSPVPINIIGLSVAETADKAPPPIYYFLIKLHSNDRLNIE